MFPKFVRKPWVFFFFSFFSIVPSLPCGVGSPFMSQGGLCGSCHHCMHHSVQCKKRDDFTLGLLLKMRKSIPWLSSCLPIWLELHHIFIPKPISEREWDCQKQPASYAWVKGGKWTSKQVRALPARKKRGWLLSKQLIQLSDHSYSLNPVLGNVKVKALPPYSEQWLIHKPGEDEGWGRGFL